MSRVLALAFAVLMLLARPAAALETAEAEGLVRNAVADATAMFVGGPFSKDETRARIHAMVNKYADLPFESELLLGRYWRKATPEQQATFADLLVPFFVATYGEMIDGAQDKPSVQFQGAENQGAQNVVVHSLLVVPGDPETVKIDWTVTATPTGKLIVSDIVADGVGLVTTIKSDFTAVIRGAGGNIEALFDAMRKKISTPPSPAMAKQPAAAG